MESIKKIASGIRSFRPKPETVIIAYKALHDALFIETAFFALAILAEGVIPGIIISHIGFAKIVILIALTMLSIAYMGKSRAIRNIDVPEEKHKKKSAIAFIVFAAIIMFNSEFKLNILINLSIVILSFAIGYLVFQVLSEKESA